MQVAYVIYQIGSLKEPIVTLGVTFSSNTANQLVEKLKEEHTCKEISREMWDSLKKRLFKFMDKREWIDAYDTCALIFKYITNEFPIYVLQKAKRIYETECNVQFIIEETEVYE